MTSLRELAKICSHAHSGSKLQCAAIARIARMAIAHPHVSMMLFICEYVQQAQYEYSHMFFCGRGATESISRRCLILAKVTNAEGLCDV